MMGDNTKVQKKIQSKNLQSPDIRTYIQNNVTNHKKTVSVKFNRVNILGLCETKSTMASIAYQRNMSTKVTQKYSKHISEALNYKKAVL